MIKSRLHALPDKSLQKNVPHPTREKQKERIVSHPAAWSDNFSWSSDNKTSETEKTKARTGQKGITVSKEKL